MIVATDRLMAEIGWLGSKDGHCLVFYIHYSGVLLQWLCHDDSTMNTVFSIIIIITDKYKVITSSI